MLDGFWGCLQKPWDDEDAWGDDYTTYSALQSFVRDQASRINPLPLDSVLCL